MDFTRQPIIETVISPRDGHKLLIRNSKEANQEEYLVNAIEIVSFGSALFFRCLERKPKAFLLPIADYDVVEVKEARMALKNISTDKPIKIGEGKGPKEENKNEEGKSESDSKKSSKKRGSRKRRPSRSEKEKSQDKDAQDRKHDEGPKSERPPEAPKREKSEGNRNEPSSSVVSVIFPPPPKIIGKTISNEPKKENEPKVEAVKEPKHEERKEPEAKGESEIATSKDLPPLEEIKETKQKSEAAKKES